MKISINKNACIGCGACESICPKVFKLKDGKATAPKETNEKCAKEAEESCPVNAIKVE